MGLRVAVAAAVAGILLSPLVLAPFQVRALEYLLFGTLAFITVFSQYNGNLDSWTRATSPA